MSEYFWVVVGVAPVVALLLFAVTRAERPGEAHEIEPGTVPKMPEAFVMPSFITRGDVENLLEPLKKKMAMMTLDYVGSTPQDISHLVPRNEIDPLIGAYCRKGLDGGELEHHVLQAMRRELLRLRRARAGREKLNAKQKTVKKKGRAA